LEKYREKWNLHLSQLPQRHHEDMAFIRGKTTIQLGGDAGIEPP
jgi:hypothetical protein